MKQKYDSFGHEFQGSNLCPKLIFLSLKLWKYSSSGREVREITAIQIWSSLWDEAYLDVTENKNPEQSASRLPAWFSSDLWRAGSHSFSGVSLIISFGQDGKWLPKAPAPTAVLAEVYISLEPDVTGCQISQQEWRQRSGCMIGVYIWRDPGRWLIDWFGRFSYDLCKARGIHTVSGPRTIASASRDRKKSGPTASYSMLKMIFLEEIVPPVQ